jgi:alanine racemase
MALRDAGIQRPILVLYPIPAGLAGAARRRSIAVTAGDPALLAALADAAQGAGDERPLDVHLEVETGLGRGGFAGPALVDAAWLVTATPAFRVAGLWTHFQAPEDLARTDRQLERFEEAARSLRTAGIQLPSRHVTASGGLLLDGVVSLDGVRPGLATYGLIPDELPSAGLEVVPGAAALRPILTLRARPVRVADLPAGHGISYGPTFTTTRPSRIATLPLGYGDGWSRALSNRASVLVRGQRVPLVGNVAMDAVMADVTDVPGPPVSVDDEFVLLGSQESERITAAEVAAARNTNSWEVVTNLAARLPRVYHAASVPRATRTLVPGEIGSDEIGGSGQIGVRRSTRP